MIEEEEFKTLAEKLNNGGNAWVDSSLGRPVLRENPETDLIGRGTEDDPYLITNVSALERLRDYVKSGKGEGEFFELTNDIDLSQKYGVNKASWSPIGSDTAPFLGTLDGYGHKIKGLYIGDIATSSFFSSAYSYKGLFASIGASGTVSNLSVTGAIQSYGNYVGGIAGKCDGQMYNCFASVDIVSNRLTGGGGYYVGGIAGECMGSLSLCGSAVNINADGNYIGGIVGKYGNKQLSLCSVYENYEGITSSITSTGSYVGGIAGSFIGGAVSRNPQDSLDNSSLIGGCTNTGAVKGGAYGGSYTGGIAGEVTAAVVENCQSAAEVSGQNDVGGIAGYASNGFILSCGVGASVSGGDNVGGIMGSSKNYSVSNSYLLTGVNVTGGGNVGGIVGKAINGMLTNCYITGKGTITGDGENVGGVAVILLYG